MGRWWGGFGEEMCNWEMMDVYQSDKMAANGCRTEDGRWRIYSGC